MHVDIDVLQQPQKWQKNTSKEKKGRHGEHVMQQNSMVGMKMKRIICGICISIAFRAKKPMEIEKTQNCLTQVKMKVGSYIHEFSLVFPF